MYQASPNASRMKAIAAPAAPVSMSSRSVIRTTRNGSDSENRIPPSPKPPMTRPASDSASGRSRAGVTRHRGTSVDDDALEEHRAEADLGPRIGEHAAKSGSGGGKIEPSRLADVEAAKREICNDCRNQSKAADGKEDAAPASRSPMPPEITAPTRLPVSPTASSRPIATCRNSIGTRSPTSAMPIGRCRQRKRRRSCA